MTEGCLVLEAFLLMKRERLIINISEVIKYVKIKLTPVRILVIATNKMLDKSFINSRVE